MGERVAVLADGKLQQVAPPQEVYDRPANLFVAEFIGSPAMNFVDTEPAQLDGAKGLRATDTFVHLSDALWSTVQAAGAPKIVVGVRPEHLVPFEGAAGAYAVTFGGKVDLVESLGSEQHVIVALTHGSFTVRLAGDARVAAGASLRLGVVSAHLHLFDAASGWRIGP